MLGIAVNGPALISGCKRSVLVNTTILDSMLEKNSQSIAYHFVCEGSARDEWCTTYVRSELNNSHLLTKQMLHGEKRKRIVGNISHHILTYILI